MASNIFRRYKNRRRGELMEMFAIIIAYLLLNSELEDIKEMLRKKEEEETDETG